MPSGSLSSAFLVLASLESHLFPPSDKMARPPPPAHQVRPHTNGLFPHPQTCQILGLTAA